MSEHPLRSVLMAFGLFATGACASSHNAEARLDRYYAAREAYRDGIAEYSRGLAHIDAGFLGCRRIDEVPYLADENGVVSPVTGPLGMTLREHFSAAGLTETEIRAAYMYYIVECDRQELRLLLGEDVEPGE